MNKETYLETRKRLVKSVKDLDNDYLDQSIAVGKKVKTKPSYDGAEFGGILNHKTIIDDGEIFCFVEYIDKEKRSKFTCLMDDIEEL